MRINALKTTRNTPWFNMKSSPTLCPIKASYGATLPVFNQFFSSIIMLFLEIP